VGDLAGDDRYPIELHLPPAHQAGVYANRLIVWHTVTEFTLDFAVAEPPRPSDPDDPASPLISQAHVVARVKIPPAIVFDVIRAVHANMGKYEAEWGEIVHPRPRDEEEGGE
jgi:hypothetical protein